MKKWNFISWSIDRKRIDALLWHQIHYQLWRWPFKNDVINFVSTNIEREWRYEKKTKFINYKNLRNDQMNDWFAKSRSKKSHYSSNLPILFSIIIVWPLTLIVCRHEIYIYHNPESSLITVSVRDTLDHHIIFEISRDVWTLNAVDGMSRATAQPVS